MTSGADSAACDPMLSRFASSDEGFRQQFDFLVSTHAAEAKPEEKPFQIIEKCGDFDIILDLLWGTLCSAPLPPGLT